MENVLNVPKNVNIAKLIKIVWFVWNVKKDTF